jgi:hypothetical protein
MQNCSLLPRVHTIVKPMRKASHRASRTANCGEHLKKVLQTDSRVVQRNNGGLAVQMDVTDIARLREAFQVLATTVESDNYPIEISSEVIIIHRWLPGAVRGTSWVKKRRILGFFSLIPAQHLQDSLETSLRIERNANFS